MPRINNAGNLLILLVGAIAFLAPLFAGIWYARDNAISQQREYLQSTASSVLARALQIGGQHRAVVEQLSAFIDAPCSDNALRAMRISALSYRYIQSALYIRDGQVLCSSIDVHDPPFFLGSAPGRNLQGTRAWADITLPWAPQAQPLLIAQADTGFGVALDADEVFFGIDPTQFGVVVFERVESGTQRLAEFGHLVPNQALADEISGRTSGAFVAGDLVGHFDSDFNDFTLGAIVVTPANTVNAGLWGQLLRVFPFTLFGSVVIFLLVTRLLSRRRSISKDLQMAIRQHEFYLDYQPILDIETQRCIGAEALLRWRRNGEVIAPDIFIPLAESNGVMTLLTDEVFRLAARDMSKVMQDSEDFYLSINLSGHDLTVPGLTERLRHMLEAFGLAGDRFMLEVTESSFVDNEHSRELIREVRRLGFKVAIDDFGTGFPNFAYLQRYEFDFLKLDRLFVETISVDDVRSNLVFHLIELAEKLNVQVIAEGVEESEQAVKLLEKGVSRAQGWLYGRPCRARRFIRDFCKPAAPLTV